MICVKVIVKYFLIRSIIIITFTEIGQYHYQEDAKIKENIKGPLFAETIPYYLKKLDGIVSENKGYFVDGEVCVYFSQISHNKSSNESDRHFGENY